MPLHDVPFDGVKGAPFEVVPVVRLPRWKEVALWFADERTLVCADVLTNAVGYKAASERIGVHPFLRLKPPGVLRDYDAAICCSATARASTATTSPRRSTRR